MTMLKERVERRNFLETILGLQFISTLQIGNYCETSWYFRHGESHCVIDNGIVMHEERGTGHIFRFVVRLSAKIHNWIDSIKYLD